MKVSVETNIWDATLKLFRVLSIQAENEQLCRNVKREKGFKECVRMQQTRIFLYVWKWQTFHLFTEIIATRVVHIGAMKMNVCLLTSVQTRAERNYRVTKKIEFPLNWNKFGPCNDLLCIKRFEICKYENLQLTKYCTLFC